MKIFSLFTNNSHPGQKARNISPARIIFLSFLIAILIGSALLSLPYATADGKAMPYIDALFTSTSATCVTGLIVRETGRDFSLFGQLVILFLIQIGGLGIMTLSTAFLLMLGKRMSLKETMVISSSLGHSRQERLPDLIKDAVLLTLTFEFIGAAILFLRFQAIQGLMPVQSLYLALFHSVSGFCNAGFSLHSTSLSGYNSDPVIILTMAGLIVGGGLGFLVLYNIRNFKFWQRDRVERGRLTLQSRIVLTYSGLLLGAGLVLFLFFEWKGSMGQMSVPTKLLNALFCSVTARTAGFNTVDYGTISDASVLLTMSLMIIGASPGSTGGGIKTCTLAVLLATSYAIVKGKANPVLFKRTISLRIVSEAIGVVSLAVLLILVMALALSIVESNNPDIQERFLPKVLFEVISAFGTVGLSLGATPYLSVLGKLIICTTMFIGRLGPVAIAIVIARRETQPPVVYPEEPVMIG